MKKTKMLKKNYEFSNVFSKGKYYSGETIEAFILSPKELNLENMNKQGMYNYLGIAIGVKNGHAYQRNKVKRLLRENYNLLENNLSLGNYMVFLWKKKKDISQANFRQIESDMKKILKDAEIYEE